MIKISDKIHAIVEEYCMTKRLYEFYPKHILTFNLCPLDGAITLIRDEELPIGTKSYFEVESEKLCELCYSRATDPNFGPIFHFINSVIGYHSLKFHNYLPEQESKTSGLIIT